MQTKMLIGGELVAGDGAATPVLDPATGKEVASVNEASPAQIEAACAAAGEAFESFGQTTPAERFAMLLAIADAIEAHNDELAELESLDCGKPFAAARDDEMPLTIDTFRFMAGAARTQGGSAAGEYVEGHTSMIRKDPIGPVASTSPWNYPLMMASWKLAAPLAAGCPVVLKPSEMTPLATLRLAEILNGILPAGVLNVIHGDGAGVGNSLINNPGVEDFDHRLAGHRDGGDEGRLATDPPCASGTRRQGAGDRVRRRRYRCGRRNHPWRCLFQCRTGLRAAMPHHGRGSGL